MPSNAAASALNLLLAAQAFHQFLHLALNSFVALFKHLL
jgi:hypothetical protein